MFGGDDAAEDNNEDSDLNGFRLVNLELLQCMIEQMACPKCYEVECKLSEVKRMGLNSTLKIACTNPNCNYILTRQMNQQIGKGKRRTSEANLMVVSAGKNCGLGYQKTRKFLAGLNVPQPLHLRTYQHIAVTVHDAAVAAAVESMASCANIVKQFYIAQILGSDFNRSDVVPVVVTYDGTWHKRGHSSHFGIGIVIELNTGLILDYKVLSNYCHGCEIGPKPQDPNYEAWKNVHKNTCQKNYNGSANSMEVGAAMQMFPRSLNQQVMYTTVLCDGDAKTIQALQDRDPYGCPIVKEDCINHVAKRMWTAIDRLKKDAKNSDTPLTGKGRITKTAHDKLAAYYACALRDNAPDVDKMKAAVYASLFHSVSTNDDPHHTHCPKGPKSWCKFQRAQATGEDIPEHKPLMKREIAEKLLPIYKRMSEPALLERCSRMRTQNANECFNAQVWRRCPKTEAASLRTVETACAMAVLEFNHGPQGYHQVLEKLGITPGKYQRQCTAKARAHRLKRGAASMNEAAVLKRRRHKTTKARQQDMQEATEGALYGSGAFNI